MQNELVDRRQKILFDHDATIALYRDTITVPGADRRTCDSCKNFAAQRGKVFPDEFLQFLKDLGSIPVRNGKLLITILTPKRTALFCMVDGFYSSEN
jgi:hypothetical protein